MRLAFRGALFGSAAAVALLMACGSSKLAGANAECFVTTDCLEGLVCIEQQDKSRRCTDDPSRAVGRLPPEAAAPDAGEAGEPSEAGPEPDATPDTGPG